MLSDGHATYTPGISENRGGAPLFRHDDLLGSLRFLTNGSQAVTGNLLSDAFGERVSTSGSLPSPFGFIGESDCQTDADTGLVLMGHRYYDTRIGRFITQDPAGDGDNWYAYAGNDPVDETDPLGLVAVPLTPDQQLQQMYGSNDYNGEDYWWTKDGQLQWQSDDGTINSIAHNMNIPGSSSSGNQGAGGLGMGGGMSPGMGTILPGPDGKSTYEYHMGEKPKPDMHIWHKGNTNGPETNIDHEGKLRTGDHHGRELRELTKKLKKVYRPIIRTFLERAGMAADAIGAALDDILGVVPIVVYYNPHDIYGGWNTQNPYKNGPT